MKASAKTQLQKPPKKPNNRKRKSPVSTVIRRNDKAPELNSAIASSAKRRQYSSGKAVLTAISGELFELFLATNRNPETPSVSNGLHCGQLHAAKTKTKTKKKNLRGTLLMGMSCSSSSASFFLLLP